MRDEGQGGASSSADGARPADATLSGRTRSGHLKAQTGLGNIHVSPESQAIGLVGYAQAVICSTCHGFAKRSASVGGSLECICSQVVEPMRSPPTVPTSRVLYSSSPPGLVTQANGLPALAP